MSAGTYSQKPGSTGSQKEHLRVLVGMSGGVYSTVTAALLKTQGHDVVGLHIEMKFPGALTALPNHCCQGNALEQAQKAAKTLGIDLHTVDATELYESKVVDELIRDRAFGGAFNPCIPCNRDVRLATLFKKAEDLRCDKVATGHGAQVFHDPRTGLTQLLQASDAERDQSFFLYTLNQADLNKLLLPLGAFPKNRVKPLAAEHGFSVENIPSQSTCFAGAKELVPFVESRIAAPLRPKGVIRTVSGEVLGEHSGLHRFKLGQPAEIQQSSQETEGFVVAGIDSSNHAVVVGPPESLRKKDCLVLDVNWLKPMNHLRGLRCSARLKADGPLYSCQLTHFENHTAFVEFDEPQGPILQGGAIAFYQETEVLGGGWIRK